MNSDQSTETRALDPEWLAYIVKLEQAGDRMSDYLETIGRGRDLVQNWDDTMDDSPDRRPER